MTTLKIKSNTSNTTLWSEIQSFIIKTFEGLPDAERESLSITTEKLLQALKKEFKGKYEPQDIAQLLKRGFEVEPGIYCFKRIDFTEVREPVVYLGK